MAGAADRIDRPEPMTMVGKTRLATVAERVRTHASHLEWRRYRLGPGGSSAFAHAVEVQRMAEPGAAMSLCGTTPPTPWVEQDGTKCPTCWSRAKRLGLVA